MIERRTFHLGMDNDSDERVVEKGRYVWGENISITTNEGTQGGVLTTRVGTTSIDFSGLSATEKLQSGTNTVVGAFDDAAGKRIIFFVHNSGGKDRVYMYDYDNDDVRFIVGSDNAGTNALKFDPDFPITGLDVSGDDVFWTDGNQSPKVLNIQRALDGGYSFPVKAREIEVIQIPPHEPPIIYGPSHDITFRGNRLKGRHYQFRYQYGYDNNVWSSWSMASGPMNQGPNYMAESEGGFETWEYNLLHYELDISSAAIKKVRVAVREGIGDWALLEEIDASRFGRKKKYVVRLRNYESRNPGASSITYKVSVNDPSVGVQTFTEVVAPSDTADTPKQILESLKAQIDGDVNYSPLLEVTVFSSGDGARAYMTVEHKTVNTDFTMGTFYEDTLNLTVDLVEYAGVVPADGSAMLRMSFRGNEPLETLEQGELLEDFHYVPEKAQSLCLASKNVLVYAGITEGKDPVIVDGSIETIQSELTTSTLEIDTIIGLSDVDVYQNNPTTYNAGPQVIFNYDKEAADTNNDFDLGTDLFTVPLTGSYNFSWNFLAKALSAGGAQFRSRLRLNGPSGTILAEFVHNTITQQALNFNGNYSGTLTTNDTVGVYVEVIFGSVRMESGGNDVKATQLIVSSNDSAYQFSGDANTYDLVHITGRFASGIREGISYWVTEGLTSNESIAGRVAELFRMRDPLRKRYTVYRAGALVNVTAITTDVAVVRGRVLNRTTLKHRGTYQYGILYYDQFMRHGSVQTSGGLELQVPDNTNFIEQYAKITLKHRPPDWAQYYSIVRTNELSFGRYLQFVINTVTEVTEGYQLELGPQLTKYDDVESATLSYSFTQGDRIRYIKQGWTGAVYTGLEADVIKYDSGLLTVKSLTTFVPQPGEIVEIFTPSILPDDIYYEVGFIGDVFNAGTATRTHGGLSSNEPVLFNVLQTQDPNNPSGVPTIIEIKEGSEWSRPKILPANDAYTATIYDRYVSPSWSDRNENDSAGEGRVSTTDENHRSRFYPATFRYSRQLQFNTNINGLNVFLASSLEDYDPNNGTVNKLLYKDRRIYAFFQKKVGAIPVFEQLISQPSGNVAVITEKLLNQIQYFSGEWGCSHPESFAIYGNNMYFIDAQRNAILRLGANGIEPISEQGLSKFTSLYLQQIRDIRGAWGAYDPTHQEYRIKIPATYNNTTLGTSYQPVLAYSERLRSWVCALTHEPDMEISGGGSLWSFKSHTFGITETVLAEVRNTAQRNVIFGVSHKGFVSLPFNESPISVKSFRAVEQQGDRQEFQSPKAWDITDIRTNLGQSSELLDADFEYTEGVLYANMLRDKNTPSVTNPLIDGDGMRGNYIILDLSTASGDPLELFTVGVVYQDSPLNTR